MEKSGDQRMQKVINFTIILVILLMIVPLQAQLKSQVQKPLGVEKAIQIPGVGSKSLGLNFIDPNRFFMDHSYSLSYSSYGGGSSIGVYQNQMSYIFSDKLMLRTRLGFMHNPLSLGSNTMTPTNMMDNLIYGIDLNYRPRENTLFRIRFDKSPYYYRSGFYPYGYY
jgi:hypothetical protein